MEYKEWTQEQSDALIDGVWNGAYTESDIPDWLIEFTLANFVFAFQSSDSVFVMNKVYEAMQELAIDKSFSQARDLMRLKKLHRKAFQEYRKMAKKVDSNYNEVWIRAEFNTLFAQAESMKNWDENRKPLLRYMTQRDEKVRDSHAIMDGITLPVDHPFWKEFYPPNDFNCRCYTVSLDGAKETDMLKVDMGKVRDETNPNFWNNPSLTGKIFRYGNTYKRNLTRAQKREIEKIRRTMR